MRRVAAVLNALCALAGLAVVTVTGAFLFFDPNDYRDRLVAAIGTATGRTLRIGGDFRLTRSLWPTIVATDVSLSNLPGGTRADMAHAELIEGQLSLPALLWHEIDITRLSLKGPNILFEQANGKPNWIFTGPPAAPAPAAAPPVAPGQPYVLRVRTAHVRDGMVTWKLPARTKVVGIRALDFKRPHADGPVEAQSTLVYSDNQPFALAVRAEPSGGVMDPWQTELHFAAFDADATAHGTMQVAGPYDLQVQAKAGALEKLNALLPELRLPALRQSTLSAHIVNGAQPGDIPVIGPATLQFVSADLRNNLPGLALAATRLSLPAPGGQAAIDSTGKYGGTAFHLTGGVGVPTHPDGKASVPIALNLAMAAGKPTGALSVKGTLALDRLSFAGVEMATTLQAKALAGLRPVFGDNLPALEDVRFAGQISVPAGPGPVRLRGVTLQTTQGDLSGDGTVDPQAGLALTGAWRSRSLDLDAMLEAFGFDLSGTAPPASNGPVIPNTSLPWAALRGPALDLTVAIGSMQFGGQAWRDVQAALTLQGGKLHAGPISVAMPGSRLEAGLTVNAGHPTTPVSFSLSAPALPLAVLAHYGGVPGPMIGTADVRAQWHAAGSTMRALASTLEGPFSITAVNGQLTNKAMLHMTSAALDALGISVPAEGETRLECFGVAGSFTRGLGTVRTIALQSTYLSLEGAGQVDLGRELLAFRIQPLARVAGSPVSVPVVVQGSFRKVDSKLDAGGLQQLGFLIDGIFGGDKSAACAKAGLVPTR